MYLYDSDEIRASLQWPYAVSAGCLVYRKNEESIEILLLAAKDPGTTNVSQHLPKGHVSVDETLLVAAQRETTEETGYAVEIQSYLGTLAWDITHPKTNFHTIKTVHYFVAEAGEKTGEMDDEHQSQQWVSVAEAKKLLGPPNKKGEDEIVRRFETYWELVNAS